MRKVLTKFWRLHLNATTNFSLEPRFSRSFATSENIGIMPEKYVWIDLEMTGLNISKDFILEVACILTTTDLNVIGPGYRTVIHQTDEILANMDDWCIKTFAKSGLTEESRNSKVSIEQAEKELDSYVKQYTKPDDTLYIAGNSIWCDRIFIRQFMPSFDRRLHHRIIDVSSIKTLVSAWYPKDFVLKPRKKLLHRSLDDILESIDELKYYRSSVFK